MANLSKIRRVARETVDLIRTRVAEGDTLPLLILGKLERRLPPLVANLVHASDTDGLDDEMHDGLRLLFRALAVDQREWSELFYHVIRQGGGVPSVNTQALVERPIAVQRLLTALELLAGLKPELPDDAGVFRKPTSEMAKHFLCSDQTVRNRARDGKPIEGYRIKKIRDGLYEARSEAPKKHRQNPQ